MIIFARRIQKSDRNNPNIIVCFLCAYCYRVSFRPISREWISAKKFSRWFLSRFIRSFFSSFHWSAFHFFNMQINFSNVWLWGLFHIQSIIVVDIGKRRFHSVAEIYIYFQNHRICCVYILVSHFKYNTYIILLIIPCIV